MTRDETILLYHEYSKKLYNTSWRIVRNEEVAQEIMHDTLLKFIFRNVKCENEQQRGAWLSRTCIRKSLDYLRRRKSEARMLEGFGQFSETIEEDLFNPETEQQAARVRDAIMEIPPPFGTILDLVLLEGLDYEEIAELSGEKEVTLRSRFSRARQKLLEKLKNDE